MHAAVPVAKVEEYTKAFYVQVKEKDTETGAFELLIDKNTRTFSPEKTNQ